MSEQNALLEQVRAAVADKIGELDGVIGLRRTAAGTAPYLFHAGDDLSQMVLSPRYPMPSIVSLLQKRNPEARFGVVARACDLRALVEMAKREQVDPDRLYLLGMVCTEEEAAECHCPEPVPQVDRWPAGERIGQPVEGAPPNPLIAEYEHMSLAERRTFWQQQFTKCIKCYGCRNICPECFCASCALEDPLWVERGVLAPPFPMFHLIRAMHMASRCVSCGQCELACPSHIPLTLLYELMRRDVGELLGYVPGTDVGIAPPIALSFEEAPVRGAGEDT